MERKKERARKRGKEMKTIKENPMKIDRLVQEIYKIMILTKNMKKKNKITS